MSPTHDLDPLEILEHAVEARERARAACDAAYRTARVVQEQHAERYMAREEREADRRPWARDPAREPVHRG